MGAQLDCSRYPLRLVLPRTWPFPNVRSERVPAGNAERKFNDIHALGSLPLGHSSCHYLQGLQQQFQLTWRLHHAMPRECVLNNRPANQSDSYGPYAAGT